MAADITHQLPPVTTHAAGTQVVLEDVPPKSLRVGVYQAVCNGEEVCALFSVFGLRRSHR